MKLIVNGLNVLPYVLERGILWKINDLEADDSGRTMDGLMHRARVASKIRLDVTCKPLATADTQKLFAALKPEFFQVTYTDPAEGDITKTMYTNNIPATVARLQEDGTVLWDGIVFPLIER